MKSDIKSVGRPPGGGEPGGKGTKMLSFRGGDDVEEALAKLIEAIPDDVPEAVRSPSRRRSEAIRRAILEAAERILK